MAKHLEFLSDYTKKLINGEKRITIRKKTNKYAPGDTVYIHAGGKVLGKAIIKDVKHIKVSEITDEIAKMDGFKNKYELIKALKSHFGHLDLDDEVTIIEFEIIEKMEKNVMSADFPYGGHDPLKIAELALKHVKDVFSEDEIKIIKMIIDSGSIRHTAIKIGGLKKRKFVRAILRRAYEELVKRGIIKPKI